ncbi:MAG: exodeoxyribonuclease VII large subunit [Lysobacteraceae bacterium]|nr:MAG: exodeoxyribonuclease VII large subunit [Xanthomonadaceae bacterium]
MSESPATDRKALTPTQLNTLARDLLEGSFPAIWVEGELGNLSRPASGHLYFTLKDERAQVRCALFKPKSQWLRFAPREGLRVLARGKLTLYEARGDYQLILDTMEEAGEGALRRAFEQLKAKLQAEGLFDQTRKRPLPAYPRRLGILTSPSGAAIRDVLSVLRRRFPLIETDVLPVPVQGDTAAAQIVAMLRAAALSRRYDVLLITRGGGSLEDLWAFNDESLARAIAASPVPVVSAIGHEIDVTLADFAADLRAPTPSVAAELLTPDREDLHARLDALQRRLRAQYEGRWRHAAQRADRAALRLQAQRPAARLELLRRRHGDILRRLHSAWSGRDQQRRARLRHAEAVLRATQPQRRLNLLAQRLRTLAPRAQAATVRALQQHTLRLQGLARSLEAVSPLATVARGYAILQREDGTVVRSVHDAQPGEHLDARLHDGALKLRVQGDDNSR